MKLPYIDRIKALFQGRNKHKRSNLSRPHTYEVEILPTQRQSEVPEASLSRERALASQKQGGALNISGKSDQFWSAKQKSGEEVVQTPSNLG